VRYYFIDKVTQFIPGEKARGLKNVTLSDEILHDHFPDYPVMPGALIVEAMAQLAGFFLEMSSNQSGRPIRRALLAQIYNAKFHDMAVPGDTLEITITPASSLEGAAQVEAEARAGDKRVARATLTFVMKEIPSDRVNEQRRYIYKLWTRDLSGGPFTIL
jgi:3-hydroxyacyl-[acyl-carrier-protein] dehydratase